MQVVSRGASETGLPRTWQGVTVNNHPDNSSVFLMQARLH